MKRRLSVWAFAVLGILMYAAPAQALPEFARRTGMSCTACHDAWPRLNDFGELYQDRGYRLGNTDDNDWAHAWQYFPASFRATPGYLYTVTTNQLTDQGPMTVKSGAFQFPNADIYVGGAMANHVSVYSDIAGFSKNGLASLESAWVRINDVITNWLNIKVGKQELYLPFSMHRSTTIQAPFLIYGYHPSGSMNPFTLDENQLAIELFGHSEGVGFRYSVALATSNDPASSGALSAPTAYVHLTETTLIASPVVPCVRFGVLGDVGSAPTQFLTQTPPGGTPVPLSGTGTGNASHGLAGADLQISFLSLSEPITLTASWLYGQDSAALVPSGIRAAQFQGGFVQLDYIPILPLIVGVRYDGVYNLQQADPTQPANAGQEVGFTAFARYYLWQSSWGSAALHFEASTVDTQNAGATPGTPSRNSFVFAAIDFVL